MKMSVREVSGPGYVPSKVGVAVATFNQAITDGLCDGAVAVLDRAGVADVMVARVRGALELGVCALALFEAGCEGVVCVGAVIKGETDHYEYVSGEVSRAITEVALRTGRPVGNAVLTVREYEQAVDRSLQGASNKGGEAAEAVLDTLDVLQGIAGVVDPSL